MTAPLNPTTTDLRKWRRLVKQARIMAATPAGAAGDLRSAAKEAFNAQAPSHDVLIRLCVPLRRLAEAFPAMDDATRRENAATLAWLAEALAPLVGETAATAQTGTASPGAGERLRLRPPAGSMADDPRPEPAPRRDIFG